MITDARAVNFSNQVARPLADHWLGQYYAAKQVVNAVANQQLLPLFPNDATPVADGAPADGRSPVSGQQIQQFYAVAQQIISFSETANTALGGATPLAVFAALAVNPRNPLG